METLESKIEELEEVCLKNSNDIRELAHIQTEHMHQDELRALRQDQLSSDVQELVGGLKEIASEFKEAILKHSEEIQQIKLEQAKGTIRLNLLYAILGAIGSAIIMGLIKFGVK